MLTLSCLFFCRDESEGEEKKKVDQHHVQLGADSVGLLPSSPYHQASSPLFF